MLLFTQTPDEVIRRGSGLVRTAVVALSTFAILLVCFSLYQYGQGDTVGLEPRRQPRLPAAPTALPEDDPLDGVERIGGMKVGDAVIGRARDIQFTLYPQSGTRAAIEISVSEYLPKPGSDHEFLLENPIARLRTRAGNDVRVSAARGELEAYRQGAGGMEPRRGRLYGGVVIEFDRRTEEDKAALAEAARERPDAADLVRIETDELEFDVEYNLLIAPAPLKLTARDAIFEAENLEVRFNDAAGRVESLRVAHGGRIELLAGADSLGVSVPSTAPEERTTIVEWLRATLQARLREHARSQVEADAEVAEAVTKSPPAIEMDGTVPVFRLGGATSEPAAEEEEGLRYLARFEGDIDATQQADGRVVSRLLADWLEIRRAFSDRSPGADADEERAEQDPQPAEEAPQERIVVTWSGPLKVDAVGAGGPSEPARRREATADAADRILAGGAPASLSSPEAEVSCAKFTYRPESGEAEFFAAAEVPVRIRFLDRGRIEGTYVAINQQDDRFDFSVNGPGSVTGDFAAPRENRPATDEKTAPAAQPETVVEFTGTLRGSGRIARRVVPEFTGHISRQESRLLDRADFDGDVRVHSDDSTLRSDSLGLTFGVFRGWQEDRQYLSHAKATGNVRWQRGADWMTCENLEIPLALSADGRSLPDRMIATQDVVAVQDGRELRADDRIVVDFDRVRVSRAGEGASPEDAEGRATGASSHALARQEAVPQRLQAYGRVRVADPTRPLTLEAAELDCTLADGRDVDQARLRGTTETPAKVSLDDVDIAGETIVARVPDQWADVPGPGRMTVRSYRSLDGSDRDDRSAIDVTWADSMQVRGRENVARFVGSVRAVDDDGTAFEADQLRVEFVDVPVPDEPTPRLDDWGLFQPIVEQLAGRNGAGGGSSSRRLNKDVASVYLLGNAVVRTELVDAETEALRTRARLAGPRLSLNLRSDVSKALLEGAGSLQIENFALPQPVAGSSRTSPVRGDLFAAIDDGAPSKTLIEWSGRMWYDFAIDQIRFEENVDLKFLSGAQIERIFRGPDRFAGNVPPGRATFLTARTLTVELDAEDDRSPSSRGFGDLNSDRIARFHAAGNVVLKDETDDVQSWITATDVVYDRRGGVIMISGRRDEQARVVRQERGRLPIQTYVDHAIYHPATGKLDTSNTGAIGH